MKKTIYVTFYNDNKKTNDVKKHEILGYSITDSKTLLLELEQGEFIYNPDIPLKSFRILDEKGETEEVVFLDIGTFSETIFSKTHIGKTFVLFAKAGQNVSALLKDIRLEAVKYNDVSLIIPSPDECFSELPKLVNSVGRRTEIVVVQDKEQWKKVLDGSARKGEEFVFLKVLEYKDSSSYVRFSVNTQGI